ncbi:RHS repeat-associated core domain-containing protein [Bordetella bronchialis]|uniref:RHS repeat-associated core domain-containing protein n=1 Tax=Bordetella bronchialis TaxID=463025 RepID=A0ABM6CTR4_9BORD|nr:RHS repeat-associated core domain-containing protein [Bordetella bronchialis]ANN67449.1 hypothetical protein BAU06_15095 [Bordetella bronchialis]
MAHTSHSGFTGARLDSSTAAYPLGNGYRWFIPALMRFNATDDFSPFGPGGINPYVYCTGDPVNHSDPSGHMGIWEDIIAASIEDAAREQRESTLREAGTYQEAKRRYADDLWKYLQGPMEAQGASTPSHGAPPPPFAFDSWHEQTKKDSIGPAKAQAAAAGTSTSEVPRPIRLGIWGQGIQGSQALIAAHVAATIPRESLTFELILEHVQATTFSLKHLGGIERQTMDRFIAVLKAYNIRASELRDYTATNIFRRFGYVYENMPRRQIENDIKKGVSVQANIDRLHWLGLVPPDPPA